MPTVVASRSPTTVADLIKSLGDVPLDRVILNPHPGTATEKDLIRLQSIDDRLYELVNGTLVEKPMGRRESLLAIWLGYQLMKYLETKNLGELSGEGGSMRLRPRLIRIPDLAFVLWENAPSEDEPPIPDLAPDLAVEVISPSNTSKEMELKRKEYFKAGTTLVWQVYPDRKEVEVYTSPTHFRTLALDDTLEGGTLLPGFKLPLADLFVDRGAGKRRGTGRKRKY
jgi:Uma2 family endonuclease